MTGARLERVRQLLEGARALQDSQSALGRAARAELPRVTGLSPENVNWAFENSFEVDASDTDLERLCACTPTAERAHVLLSANVFVAALRAIAIGIACAPRVCVRPSRREPLMAELLARAAPGQFQLVERLAPLPGDHGWAYGSDATLTELRLAWPENVTLHAHGSGYGAVVLDASDLYSSEAIEALAAQVAIDVAAFDQRGCLSPRVVLIQDQPDKLELFSHALATAMTEREKQIPVGLYIPSERAEVRRFRDSMCVAGRVLPAHSGLVTYETEPLPWIVPPGGRVLHVRAVSDAPAELRAQAAAITTVGVNASNTRVAARIRQALPDARLAHVGRMQCPRLDGPADLRGLPGLSLRFSS